MILNIYKSIYKYKPKNYKLLYIKIDYTKKLFVNNSFDNFLTWFKIKTYTIQK